MSDTIRIDITGTEETANRLKNMNKQKLEAASQAILDSAFFVEGEVKEAIAGRRSPLPRRVDTGNYMSSVHARQLEKLSSTVESTIKYAKFLEYGTSKLSPGQHFKVTGERNKSKIQEFVADAINS